MINPAKLATVRNLWGWPTFILLMAFIALPAFNIAIPLTVTAIAFPIALCYMIFNLISQSEYLTLDGRHRQPNASHIAILAPIGIGLLGAQYSDVGQLDGHAILFILCTMAFAAICLPVMIWVGRKHKPLYEEVRHFRAQKALKLALDNAAEKGMAPQTRAEVEARAETASYEDLEFMAESITQTGKNLPELFKQ